MKTAELTGAALAYWATRRMGPCAEWMEYAAEADGEAPLPLDWAACGPIIERDKIGSRIVSIGGAMAGTPETIEYRCSIGGGPELVGPTHLVAAMRAKVASVYGEEVLDEVAP
jgi:hypothetical protein